MTDRIDDTDLAEMHMATALSDASGFPSILCNAKVMLQVLSELITHRAQAQSGGWKPFWFDESTPIREGHGYLFAAGSAVAGWSYFHDALVWDWDAESYAQWRDGDHGFATEDVKFYWELPAPPKGEPAAPTEGT